MKNDQKILTGNPAAESNWFKLTFESVNSAFESVNSDSLSETIEKCHREQ